MSASSKVTEPESTDLPVPPEAGDSTSASADAQVSEPEEKAGNAEAAKWRTKLRDTEGERDALNQQVESLRRSQVDRAVEEKHRIKPAALWAAGTELADVLDDDGDVDAEKLAEAVATAKETLGISKGAIGPYVPNEGKNARMPLQKDSWSEAFKPK